jgi:methionyl-tRNA synthetase
LAEYEALSFSRALEIIWAAVAAVDGYVTVRKPWALAKDPAQRKLLETVLHHAAQSLRVVVALAHPALPQATSKMWHQLGQSGQLGELRIDQLAWGQFAVGTKIGEVAAVFPRIERKEALETMANMEQEMLQPGAKPANTPSTTAAAAPTAAPAASTAAAPAAGGHISIDDFAKVELRVGLVKSAERVAGADKLMKLMVDIGDEVRQIVAGIATAYTPEQLPGRKVVVVVNLAPRKLRGVESNGMIVAATDAEGKPVLASFIEDVPVGAKLK